MNVPPRGLDRRHVLGGALAGLLGAVSVSAQTVQGMPRPCLLTLPKPAGWRDVIGYPLAGDADPLPAGHLRLHLLQGVEHRGTAEIGLPQDQRETLLRQAQAVLALRDLAVPQDRLSDVTAAAARRGITPRQFRGPERGGKYRQPTAILMMPQPEGAIWFTGMLPIDLPAAPLTGTLHALWRAADGRETYAQVILGNLAREKFPQIVAEAFLFLRNASRSCV